MLLATATKTFAVYQVHVHIPAQDKHYKEYLSRKVLSYLILNIQDYKLSSCICIQFT